MSRFLLNFSDQSKTIIEYKVTNGYTFNPRNRQKIKVKSLTIYDQKGLEKIIENKYSRQYARLAEFLQKIFENDENTEADFMLGLDAVSKLQEILVYKYQECLKKEKYERFLKDLYFLEKVLKDKIIERRTSEILERQGR
ncbi:MAG: hypothetical protein E7164_04885 [Firmicutes bacterium]|nr:hypothetical protein [Bacillota bacterium]